MGVAVQSHYFSVGSVVTWARAGVGAVATQALVEPSYGPLGLELMAGGKTAPEALKSLVSADPRADTRQVAMVDSVGLAAAHTGEKCIPYAGHATGLGVSCQGNIMRTSRVWRAMKIAYERNARLALPERLIAALEAAENEGGDARGRQSAAVLVVRSELRPSDWEGTLVELRVEDHESPVTELKRLLRYKRGYDFVEKGDNQMASGKQSEALKSFERAMELVPEVDEIKYWVGINLLPTRKRAQGVSLLKEVFSRDASYVKLTRRMIKAKSLPIHRSVEEALP